MKSFLLLNVAVEIDPALDAGWKDDGVSVVAEQDEVVVEVVGTFENVASADVQFDGDVNVENDVAGVDYDDWNSNFQQPNQSSETTTHESQA